MLINAWRVKPIQTLIKEELNYNQYGDGEAQETDYSQALQVRTEIGSAIQPKQAAENYFQEEGGGEVNEKGLQSFLNEYGYFVPQDIVYGMSFKHCKKFKLDVSGFRHSNPST